MIDRLNRILAGAQERLQAMGPPLVFLPDEVDVRFFLDSQESPFRTFGMHQKEHLWVSCPGDGCELCECLAQMLAKYDNGNAWQFAAQIKTILYCQIFSTTSDNPNIKTGVPVILLGPATLGSKLFSIIERVSAEEFEAMFNPEVEDFLWKIRKEDKSLEITRCDEKGSCKPLPKSYPALSAYRVKEGIAPTPDEIRRFKGKIDDAFRKPSAIREPY
jgi:hypothetical protein